VVTERSRLFFALWPDAAVRAGLDETARALLGKRVKRVSAGNLHITLAFLGGIDAGQQSCFKQAAAAIRMPSFVLTLDHAGYWERPRIFWLGSRHPTPALLNLAMTLHTALIPCGFTPEPRAYNPHVTLARKYTGRVPDDPPNAVTWQVENFSLVESLTRQEGAVYRVLETWPLVDNF
jgi:2'-5' RNA ligase